MSISPSTYVFVPPIRIFWFADKGFALPLITARKKKRKKVRVTKKNSRMLQPLWFPEFGLLHRIGTSALRLSHLPCLSSPLLDVRINANAMPKSDFLKNVQETAWTIQ